MLEDNDHGSNPSWDIGVDEDGCQVGLKPEGTLISGAAGSGKSHALWKGCSRGQQDISSEGGRRGVGAGAEESPQLWAVHPVRAGFGHLL